MNIWYVHPYAGGPGIGRYWRPFYLAKAWMDQGHDVTVITSSYHHLMDGRCGKCGERLVGPVRYRFLPTIKYEGNGIGRMGSMLMFSISLFLWGSIKAMKGKPDIVIYSSAHPFGFISAWVIKKLSGARLIFEVRDLWPLSVVEIAGYKRTHPFVRLLSVIESFAYKSSDTVVSLLPGAKLHMIAKGMRRDKFIYASNGFAQQVAEGNSVVPSNALLAKLDSLRRNGAFVYFYAGAFGEPNAMHKFVDALEVFDDFRPDNVQFVLVGKGEQYAEIKERCESLGFDYVTFYPQVDKQVVDQAMKRVDAAFFVMHDLPIYRFGISLNKLFDYMAASIPIVGAYCAFNDPIAESGCGISVAPDSAKKLATAFAALCSWSSEERQVAGRKGRTYLEANFEYSVLAARILAPLQPKDSTCE